MPEAIILERLIELEAQVLDKKLYEQYLDKLIKLTNVYVQLYFSTVEPDMPLCQDMPLEIFRLCTASLELRYQAATFVLAHPDLPRESLQ